MRGMSEVKIATVETDGVEDLVRRPEELDPVVLTEAIRYLQQRLPGAVALTARERQAMGRVANLDPELIDHGLSLGAVWEDMKLLLGASAEEVRGEQDAGRDWEELERTTEAFLEMLRAANLKRRHRIGTIVLDIYSLVGHRLHGDVSARDQHLAPYYERMKSIFLRLRKKKSRKTAKDEEPPEE